jgi:CRP-like cAMP-binding protein
MISIISCVMSDALQIFRSLPHVRPADRQLRAGETLFLTGERITHLFAIMSGRVDLLRHMPDGSVIRLQTAGAGEFLAEASLFSQSYHCDGEGAEPSTLQVFSKPAVLKALKADPDIALALLGHFAGRLQALRGQAALLAVRSAHERVLAWLQMQPDSSGGVRINRSWKQIAAELGLTHEAVYRALARLEREGAIKRLDGGVQLLS